MWSCLRALAQAVPLLGILLLHGLNLLKHSPLSESILTIPFKSVTSATHHFPCPLPSYLLPQQLSSDTLYNYYLLLFPFPQLKLSTKKTGILTRCVHC